jgi:hypothetical protein
VSEIDEKAMAWCQDELDHEWHTDKSPCKAIAAFGRECAAQAVDGAEKVARDFGWHRSGEQSRVAYEIAAIFEDRAAALRKGEKA